MRNPKTWTAEERKIVNEMASNWAGERKPNQEGYTFFQAPSPKTGEQGLPDFFEEVQARRPRPNVRRAKKTTMRSRLVQARMSTWTATRHPEWP